LRLVDLADESGFAFPITQIDLAECAGMTSVHVNRVLRDLREDRLAEFRRGRVSIFDVPKLRRLAEFDEAYLYMNEVPL
jgi:transcription initiation factor IIE alpha subunit